MPRQESTHHSYGQYCPITRALDVLGDRWSLLIIRDMLCGTTRFNDLARGLPGLSRSLLSKRLRHLERHGVIDKVHGEYVLSEAGRELEPVVFALGGWGARWVFDEPDDAERDPELLVWWMHTRLDTSGLPGVRHVVSIEFTDVDRRFWILIERGAPSVCVTDPGYDVDLVLRASVAALYRVWLGHTDLRQAMRAGDITAQGQRAWTRRLATILQLSQIAPIVMLEHSRRA